MQSKLTQPKSPLIQHRPLTMFGRIRQRLRNAYQTVVNPPDERTVHRNIYLFELYMGLRPFELIYPPDDEARPRLQLSRRGFACMCVHITILLISFATYLILDPKNIMGISDDLLATKGNEFSGAVHLLSTVLIYWTIFWHRNSQLVTARLERRFNEHLHSIGVDLRPLCRRTARVALTGGRVVVAGVPLCALRHIPAAHHRAAGRTVCAVDFHCDGHADAVHSAGVRAVRFGRDLSASSHGGGGEPGDGGSV